MEFKFNMNIVPRKISYLLLLITVTVLASCGKQKDKIEGNGILETKSIEMSSQSKASDLEKSEASESEIFALDTAITLKVYGSKRVEVLKKLEDKINELDDMLSTGKETSEVSRLNRSGEAVLSPTMANLIKRSKAIYNKTDGLFDITI